VLKVIAVRYWARTMRSPAGELCFAAHTRHAEPEMRAPGPRHGGPDHQLSRPDEAARVFTSVDSPPPVSRRCYFWLVRRIDTGAGRA
jgi:hypothetical protein